MTDPRHEVREWMQPDTSEVRLNRMWSRLSARRSSPRAAWWALAGVVATAAVALALFALTTRARTLHEADTLAAAAARFEDGSSVELDKAGFINVEVERPELTRVLLSSGRAVFEVERRLERKFEVRARDVVVRVVGTRFTVTVRGQQVEVGVERGVVEVESLGGVRRLTAGEEWVAPALTLAPEVPELAADEAPAVDDLPAPNAPAPQRPPRSKRRGIAEPKQPATAPVAEVPASGGESLAPAPDPAALFKAALDARRDGKTAEAAKTLERFLAQFPTNPRAAVAAFELGRLRMDALSDTSGAVLALERSLELQPAADFREEALSRLTRGYEALGRSEQCLATRARYLEAFPDGSYVLSVRARCGQR